MSTASWVRRTDPDGVSVFDGLFAPFVRLSARSLRPDVKSPIACRKGFLVPVDDELVGFLPPRTGLNPLEMSNGFVLGLDTCGSDRAGELPAKVLTVLEPVFG